MIRIYCRKNEPVTKFLIDNKTTKLAFVVKMFPLVNLQSRRSPNFWTDSWSLKRSVTTKLLCIRYQERNSSSSCVLVH